MDSIKRIPGGNCICVSRVNDEFTNVSNAKMTLQRCKCILSIGIIPLCVQKFSTFNYFYCIIEIRVRTTIWYSEC